jgi:hypothetical protein
MMRKAARGMPVILFGAFDRHNFGDLLFPHIAATLLKESRPMFAGLAQRDFRHEGGHRVRAITRLAAEWANQPVKLVHAGGELLTCDAWSAAVMLLPPEKAQAAIVRLSAMPAEERLAWARDMLGMSTLAPYVIGRELFPLAGLIFNAVGGVDLDAGDPGLRAEVLATLGTAEYVGVRDLQTRAQLEKAGIAAHLLPDPAVMVAELFGARIDRHAQRGEVARAAELFPQGYIAVQFSSDFGDDATLDGLAAELKRITAMTGYGIALFRAGAARWHDDLDCYRRLTARLPASTLVCTSLNLWDICTLIARSRGYCGSSLHGRIVALAFALPRVNLVYPAQPPGKHAAFVATWEHPDMPGTAPVHELAQKFSQALATKAEERRGIARMLAGRYRKEFAPIHASISAPI